MISAIVYLMHQVPAGKENNNKIERTAFFVYLKLGHTRLFLLDTLIEILFILSQSLCALPYDLLCVLD